MRSLSVCAFASAITIAFLCASCASKPAAPSGLDLAGMDKAVAPGDDFNAYANGGWLKATVIPADKSSYGDSARLADEARKNLRDIVETSAKSGDSASADMRKVGDYYTSFMEEAAIEAKGIAPLNKQLDEIAAMADRHALAKVIGSYLRADVDALNSTNFETDNLFGFWITQGLSDPTHAHAYIMQGGLGLPDRDYYLSATPHMDDLRKKYQAHIEAMFKLAGFAESNKRAARVFALEMKMAKVHATRVESEDVHSAVSWTRAELIKKAPGLDWPVLLESAGLKDSPDFIVWHPKAIPGLAALAGSESMDSWKDWLVYHLIERSAPYLPKAFVEERFNFYAKSLSGVQQLRERWQRGMDFTSDALGEVVGKLYVDKFFPPATKEKLNAMVADIVQAFGKRIDALTWMSPETKVRARQKLTTLKVGVGYPDKWKDYSGLEIVKGDALGNAQRASLFEYHAQLAKLHQPIDRGEWWMVPQVVNAVNLPLQNALNFPAAILQPPYFKPDADAAYNFGAVGAVIGHEISHSFDDQGSQFDAEGRLANWWTKEDLDHFKAAGEALAAQFDAYKPFPDLAVNGHQTLGENIADVAGLLASYDAYKLSLAGKPDVTKDGFTGDQRFFISFAQSWRSKTREAALRRIVATDGHAPDEYRADTARNLDSWYDAFQPRSTQKLFLEPAKRVPVW